MHGLPQESIEVRVMASISGPEIDFAELDIFGFWTCLQTDSPGTNEDVEALGDRDLFGGAFRRYFHTML